MKKKNSKLNSGSENIIQSLEKMLMTEEDMRRLQRELSPVPEGPFELGWPHYCALLNVINAAERLWYEEKARNQALTLRELERIIRENLFYKILSRRPPGQMRLGRANPAPKIKDNDLNEDPAFKRLVLNIEKVIKKAEDKGIAFRHRRDDILNCTNCGAYEDVLCGEEDRRTYLFSGEETEKTFSVIDHKETVRYYEHGMRYSITYSYVCGVCGAWQSSLIKCIHMNDNHS